MISELKHKHRDEGLTLPELLIGVVVFGMLMYSISAAIIVIARQNDNSTGRLNNARSEQNVGVWMPADLASAQTVSVLANASPCGTSCPVGLNVGGSNALMLEWDSQVAGSTSSVNTHTAVSYRYLQVGTEWQMIRIGCTTVGAAAPTCSSSVILHNLPAPPDGVAWVPGTTVP